MAFHSYNKQGDLGDALVEKQRSGYSGSEFADPRWSGIGGGAAQMADHELEEGEACDEPDLGCDPDTDFSYLDDKISRVLGDVQKCFEGGVSAETLGSKFGGYGSFLPTQERPQSNLHQDKAASALASDAYCRTKKSANEGFTEMTKQNATSTSMQATNLKTEDNAGIPKKVTLKIKMGPQKREKKNTTIYSDFGLSNSSSEAEDELVDEDHRTDSDLESSPDRTPLTMIRIMTSHHIPDGMLLSPLPDLVTEPFIKKERRWSGCQEEDGIDKARSPGVTKLNRFKGEEVCEKVEISKEKTKEHAGERIGDTGTSSDRVSKRAKVDKERGSSKESSRHSSKPPSRAYRKDLAKVNEIERQARDAVSESGTGVTSNESHKDCKGFSLDGCPPDYARYDVDHMAKDICSPSQAPPEVDSDRELHSRGYRVEKVASSSNDSINEHLITSHHGRDFGKEVVNTMGSSLHGKREADVSLELSDGKRRSSGKTFLLPGEEKPSSGHNGRSSTSKGSGAGKIAAPVTDVPTREMAESKKRLLELGPDGDGSRGTSREKGKGSSKEAQKSNVKDRYSKTSIPAELAMDEPPKDVLQLGSKATFYKDYKESQQGDMPKGHKAESVENKRKEKAKRRATPDYVNKEPSKVSDDRHRDLATREISTKNSHPTPEPVNNDLPSQAGALSQPPAGNGVAPYVLVMDNWVECDKCKQWRLLPPGVEDADLPQKWHCKMLHWLEKEGLNNCSAPEEVTNQMTRAVYNMSVPIPQPVVDNTAAVGQIQPPVALVTSVPPSNAAVNQEIKPPEKSRGSAGFKKHKAPRTSSSDNVVPGKSKNIVDSAQIIQDVNQTKPAGGDTITSQEKTQAKVVGPYCPPKTGEEKLRVKERDKARRHRSTDGSSPSGKKQSQTPANLALREATKLKHKADSLKGQERASTALYLQAALKFLQAASMLESEASEHGDSRHGPLPVKLYADTGKLCEYCASTYERNKDLAAAAISYKCAGVARMRVVQAKNSHINKCRAEVQNAQHVAQGDSPTSSTKVEMDALKNSAPDGPFAQGSNPSMVHSHMGGPLIIAAKSRSSFAQIMDYVMDTSKALDAMTKSLHAFRGAESALSSCTIEGISALKRVLDYSFHDVDNFVRLVRIALEAMGH